MIGLACARCALGQTPGQVALYEETFPYPGLSGNFSATYVGWANDAPNEPDRLYQISGGDGAMFAYEGAPATTAFYTSSALSARSGAVFPIVDISLYSGLALSVDIEPYLTPSNILARFAVQMNGSAWFVAAKALRVPGVVGRFATYSIAFNPASSQWNSLTVSGDGSGSGAVIGPPATGNLTGDMTGAGLVFTHSGNGGTLNFDNFGLTAGSPGKLSVCSVSNGAVSLCWPGALNVALQSATTLGEDGWSRFPGTAGQAAAIMPMDNVPTFFRLYTFPMGGLQDGDFESASLSSYWQVSGDSGAVSSLSGGAFSGSRFLQISSPDAYHAVVSQTVTNLPNGYYKLTAMVQNGGGQNACYIAGNDRMTSLPVSSQWTNVIVRGIHVTNCQCDVRVCADSPVGGYWGRLDAMELIKDDVPYTFIKGGDVSELSYVERGGGIYYETNGAPMDCLQILKNHGCNTVRLRLYNDPGNPNFQPSGTLPQGIQSPTNILDLARRAKALGLQIELTFYYSDAWPSAIPHDWTNLTYPQLTNEVFAYTSNFMAQMRDQGTAPEYVSIGNEIDGQGLLLPYGSPTNWPQLAPLLKAGCSGVKAAFPSSQTVLHVANVNAATIPVYLTQAVNNGVQWDIIGCSFYPFWTRFTAEQARDQIDTWYATFKKPVLIMETGYDWSTNTCDGVPGQLSNNGPEPFPSTPLGQKEFMLNCFNALKLVDGGHCIGDLYWDPIFICAPGEGWELGQPNVVDNTTLFDFTGHALPVLDAFLFNN